MGKQRQNTMNQDTKYYFPNFGKMTENEANRLAAQAGFVNPSESGPLVKSM